MIANRDFFVLSDDWTGSPASSIHLFRHIAPHNRVFWLNVINRLPRFTWTDLRKVAGTLRHWAARRRGAKACSAGENHASSGVVYSSTPFMIPWFKPAVRRFNGAYLHRMYRKLSSRYAVRDPIVVTAYPSTVDFVKRIDAPLKVYYCVDEWLKFPGLNAADFRVMEQELLDTVDGFVATSRVLMSKGRRCRATLYLPHGVDFQHFQQNGKGIDGVRRMEGIRQPIVGFFGLIAPWVDLNLIAALSRAFPDVSFVLLGRTQVSLDILAECRNVHYLGPVPYAELPRYARHFRAGLIPFTISELTKAVNPLKLLEYYALGLPVVATRLPELEAVGGPIRLASTPDEFLQNLGDCLKSKRCVRDDAVAIARRSTWQQRAEEFSSFLEGLAG